MIKSMTGYGKGQSRAGGIALGVEIKTVNHRFGDISVKAPRFLMPFEHEVKKRVGERLKRGKIDVYVTQESSETLAAVPVLNKPLAQAYIDVFSRAKVEYDLEGEMTLSLLTGQRDVITLEEAAFDQGQVKSCLEEALGLALEAVERMRRNEGRSTLADIEAKFGVITALLDKVKERAPLIPDEWKSKLRERLARIEGEFEVDPQRLAQEVALFADRCDISEEIARIESHLQQFNDLLGAGEPVGRQLDFLVQELNREANTMGSKSNDADLTRLVVSLKAELEKIREQAQNVE